MSDTAPVAGWYPDPAGGGGRRWWDGSSWSEQTEPGSAATWGMQPGVPGGPDGPAPSNYPPGYGMPVRRASLLQRNQLSLTTVVVLIIYLAIGATLHWVFVGILPVLLAVRAINRKEPLAVPAMVLAVIGLVIGLTVLF